MPSELAPLIVSLLAIACSGGVLALWIRSAPRRLQAAQDELAAELSKVKRAFQEAVGELEAIEARVDKNLDELQDLHERVDRKRARIDKNAERAAKYEAREEPADTIETAAARARAAGWGV